jgi:hypothetical protein
LAWTGVYTKENIQSISGTFFLITPSYPESKRRSTMKASRFLLVISSLSSFFIAVLASNHNHRLRSKKELREIQQRLDVFGLR